MDDESDLTGGYAKSRRTFSEVQGTRCDYLIDMRSETVFSFVKTRLTESPSPSEDYRLPVEATADVRGGGM